MLIRENTVLRFEIIQRETVLPFSFPIYSMMFRIFSVSCISSFFSAVGQLYISKFSATMSYCMTEIEIYLFLQSLHILFYTISL